MTRAVRVVSYVLDDQHLDLLFPWICLSTTYDLSGAEAQTFVVGDVGNVSGI